MTVLQQGQNAPLGGFPVTLTLRWEKPLPDGLDVDASVYLLTSAGKVRGDGDMVFYGLRSSGDGGTVLSHTDRKGATFRIASLPDGIERAAIAAVADDTVAGERSFAEAGAIEFVIQGPGGNHSYSVDPAATGLAAVIVAEVYVRNGEVKVRAVGQGFAGGLKPLAEHFGVEVADDTTTSAPAAPTTVTVSLEKRLISLEKVRPGMVSLVKKSDRALVAAGLAQARAKFYLALDISASMDRLYRSGKVDILTERALALGFRLDDDGMIDVFLFGQRDHHHGQVGPADLENFTRGMLARHPLEPGTMYGLVMERIRAHYRGDPDFGRVPAFVMFVTDGGTQDTRRSETQIMEASREAIFWKFMAIGDTPKAKVGGKGNRLPKGFDFLAYLDDMKGRLVDNADFFAVSDPIEPTNEELYGLLLQEFPAWLEAVRKAGILKP